MKKRFPTPSRLISYFLPFGFLCFLGTLAAQVSQYKFSELVGNYAAVTGGILLGTTASDDQFFVNPGIPTGGTAMTGAGFPIGFSFTFDGFVFDRVGINTNGWLSFGQSALGATAVDMTSSTGGGSNAWTPLSANTPISPAHLRCRVAAFGSNLQAQPGSSLRIQTSGTAPGRVCVIQWSNYKRFGAAGTGDHLNGQIRLYEGCNAVVIAYGANTFGAANTANTQVGLGGTAAADFNNRTSTYNWNATTAGGTAADGCSVGLTKTPPVNGRTFFWSIPPCATCTSTTAAPAFRRRDIGSFTAAERSQLKDLIVQFIGDISNNGLGGYSGTQYHSLFGQHNNCNFFPWHRDFLKKLEDYLLKQPGGECYVPLPKWTPTLPIPIEFFWNGTTGTSSSVTNGTLLQQDPFNSGPHIYDFTALENNPCANSLCAFSNLVENEHGKVHVNTAGVMGNIPTAAGAAVFYLWHAYIDDLYWNYESSCTPWVQRDCDLYTRDNDDDSGVEPNPNVQVWNSPDIWVRNTPDVPAPGTILGQGHFSLGCVSDALRHQNPEYTAGQPVYVYVKVRNRGSRPAGGMLTLNYTQASAGEAWPDTWFGLPFGPSNSGIISSFTLPTLAPGQIFTFQIPWFPPNPGANPAMYCLLTRIESLDDPMVNEPGTFGAAVPIFGNVLNNNNIATKNLYVVNNVAGIVGNSGVFHMTAAAPALARIRFAPRPHPESGLAYTDIGTVTVALGDFYANWEQAMFAASSFIEDIGGGNIRLLGDGDIDDYWINAVLEPDDTSAIRLLFELNPGFSQNYGYRDWNFEFSHEVYDISATGQPPGLYLGAQHYNIAVDYPCEADAGSDTLILTGACTVIGSPSDCASCTFEWSENGVVISGATGPTLQVCPTVTATYVLTVSDIESGCRFTDTTFVYVDRICTAAIGPSQYVIEHGQCVQIGGSGSTCPDCDFHWTPATGLSDPNIPNPTACPMQDIVYTLTVSRDSFCFAEASVSVHVYHCDGMADAGPDQTIALGEGVVIGTPDAMGMAAYSWFPQEGLDNPYAAQPFAQPAQTTTYTVYVHHPGHDCFLPASDSVTVTVCRYYYADADGDAYGSVESPVFACTKPAGYVADSTDCNDSNPYVYPAAAEICNNGLDDNCNGQIDENGSVALNLGLTAYFPFNASAEDVSPTAIDGAGFNTAPANALNAPNSAFHFDGATSWVNAGPDNRGVSNAVSMVAWVKTTETVNGQWVMGKYSFDEDRGYSIGIGNSLNGFIGQVVIGGRDGTGIYHLSGYSATPVNDGQWHCLVGTAGNGEWKIYVDGTQENGAPGSTIDLTTSAGEPLTIGWHTHPSFPLWMNGAMDDVRLYNRVLTDCEIDSLCSTSFVSGISDASPETGVRLYPNPTTGSLTVEWEAAGLRDVAVQIAGPLGHTLRSWPVPPDATRLDVPVSDLPAGVYFVKMLAGGRLVKALKFVKQ